MLVCCSDTEPDYEDGDVIKINGNNSFPKLRKLEDQWMVNLGSLASLDPVNGCNSKDDAKASARTSGS